MGMRREKDEPTYSLDEAKRLAIRRQARFNGKPRRFIQNHLGRYDLAEVAKEVFQEIKHEHFYKSEAMDALDGRFADIYRQVPYGGDEWYVKFYISDGKVMLNIMSCKWEGVND